MRFEWDRNKAQANIVNHGISFEEALSVFSDEDGLLIHDPDHSEDEDRFVLLGMSSELRTLVVCHCYRKNGKDETIRIISARRAGKNETRQYWSRRS